MCRQHMLAYGTPDEVAEYCEGLITDICMKGGVMLGPDVRSDERKTGKCSGNGELSEKITFADFIKLRITGSAKSHIPGL